MKKLLFATALLTALFLSACGSQKADSNDLANQPATRPEEGAELDPEFSVDNEDTGETADKFVRPDTLLILALGLVAFIFDTAGGVFFAKLLNLFLPEGKKINPMIGAAGISAFPMSGRVVNQMGLAEDNQNFLLMYSISVNVSGQIASVIAGGLILTLMSSCV